MSARSSRSVNSEGHRRLRSAQLEEQLVRKRQAEYDRLNFWNNNSTYFKTWEFNTALHSSWADERSLENLKKLEEMKRKREALEERRRKLKRLLENEENEFQKELKKKTKPVLLEDLNAANIAFLLKEEEARRRERDIKMHHYWRQNQPCIRNFERKQHYDHVRLSWLQQVVEKQKEREAEEKKMLEHMKELKRMQEEREEKEKQLKEEKKRTEMELKNFLEKQMELARCKQEQQVILKSEENEILKLQNELEELIEERRRIKERQKRTDLRKQYQLLLQQRAKEVQENLECDRKFLEKLANERKYELDLESERVQKYKKNLEIAREMCRKQAEIEKIKRSQAEFLFDEEAKKMYEKQEAQWKMESEARKNLLDDVLKDIQCQIKTKLLENLKIQEKVQEEREIILKILEDANKELKEFQEKSQKALESWQKSLDQQILEKKLQVYYKKKKEEEDKENFLRAKREEEEKLCKELTEMYLTGYKPKATGRRNFTFH